MIASSDSRLSLDAVVFDAYGTLFDVYSVEATADRLFPGHGGALSNLWRTKQLEYTWLQSLMQSPTQRREDFAAVTAHALEYAATALALTLTPQARHRLLDAYLDLAPFPDVESALARLAPNGPATSTKHRGVPDRFASSAAVFWLDAFSNTRSSVCSPRGLPGSSKAMCS